MSDVSRAAPVRRGRHRWLWPVAFLTATVCLVIFLRAIDVRAAMRTIAGASPGWIAAAVFANFAVLPLMTEQWRHLLPRGKRPRWGTLWTCVTVSMASMNTLPFGGGHAVAAGLLVTTEITDVPGAVSLLALEQLCEGLARIALLIAVIATAPLPWIWQRLTWILPVAVLAGFAALWCLARTAAMHPEGTGWRARWGRHLDVLRRPRVFLFAATLSVAMKVLALAAVFAVQEALGIHLSLGATLLVLAAVTFATAMAVSPGNVGTYELAAIAAYRLAGVPAAESAALGLALHACFLLPMLGVGYGQTFWRSIRPVSSPPRRAG
ncbi:MAG TPA: lysylphosphatidylglycerol synthase transmembrane domain-containing protein [Opitutaceae bacterium]|nr:lysylphosphatidylglycerol synthase transmembrane domain-containing protein [Opitutaceae bacterium]